VLIIIGPGPPERLGHWCRPNRENPDADRQVAMAPGGPSDPQILDIIEASINILVLVISRT
jgi:hypothetical protein